MKLFANFVSALIALEHIGILILEMFFWDRPVGRRIFGMTPELSAATATLAVNQGLYNGFLAAGLIWGLISDRRVIKLFFLACIVIAGIFGGITAKPSIFLAQALPALIALVLVHYTSRVTPKLANVHSNAFRRHQVKVNANQVSTLKLVKINCDLGAVTRSIL